MGESNTISKLKLTLATTMQVKMLWLCDFQAGSRRSTLMFNFHTVWHRSACPLPPHSASHLLAGHFPYKGRKFQRALKIPSGPNNYERKVCYGIHSPRPGRETTLGVVSQAVRPQILPALAHNLCFAFVSGPPALEDWGSLEEVLFFVGLRLCLIFFKSQSMFLVKEQAQKMWLV